MNIALIGGTHGNETVGIEVMRIFKEGEKTFRNPFTCFWGNPHAFKEKKRYIDTDLNRAFGAKGIRKGYEQVRAEYLEQQIKGRYDFAVDLHTTTSNMGATLIINNTHPATKNLCAYLSRIVPDIKLIVEEKLDDDCNHLNRLCPGGVTVEVGPVANNVIAGDIVRKMHHIVESIMGFDFTSEENLSKVQYYQMLGAIHFPKEGGWYIHHNIDQKDFCELKPKDPIFINIKKEELLFKGRQKVYPFFVNEAAYMEKEYAFLYAEKKIGLDNI